MASDSGKKLVCHWCGQPGDLRPYGPKGAPVCHPCTVATPERNQEAGDRFLALLYQAFENPNVDVVIMDANTGALTPIDSSGKKNPDKKKEAG